MFHSAARIRVYRAAVLAGLVILIHLQGDWLQQRHAPALTLRQAARFFPDAHRIELRDREQGLSVVLNERGEVIGGLLLTAPQTDHIIGYSGPNNLLVALRPSGAILGLDLVDSGDTKEYVDRVRADSQLLPSFLGWESSRSNPPTPQAVSGATLTSMAVAESVQHRLAGATPSLRFPEGVTFEEARNLFPDAATLSREPGRLRVENSAGALLGFLVRTSPQADNISGWRGPTECLLALSTDGDTVVQMHIRRSYDTDSYVDQVRRAQSFRELFVGKSLDELTRVEFPRTGVDGISGATQTARAISTGIRLRAEALMKRELASPGWQPGFRDFGMIVVIGGALIMSFSPLRGNRRARTLWQLFLVGYVGFFACEFLSLSLFSGWALHGIALHSAPSLALLAAAAFLLPWITRRQVYCHQICPHGAAQQLLGGWSRWRLRIPAGVGRILQPLPVVLLSVGLLAVLAGWNLDLTELEPFSAWAWRTAGLGTIVVALVGLVAALFVPQAYCRYGCPTGALLGFVRSSGSTDRWSRRDSLALGLVVSAILFVISVRLWPRAESGPEPFHLHGPTMGTTWSLRIRDELAHPAELERSIAAEFEWAESLTSHWRTNTDISDFNRSRSSEPMPVPWPVLTLSRWAAEISRNSGGAFDITVGPLVRLWGFGPESSQDLPPPDEQIARAREGVGWQKLDILDGMIRKQHPALEIDLSSIAKGWAIDHVFDFLNRKGYTNFLVECGGELRARGKWNIQIEFPDRLSAISDEAIATSGTYRQDVESDGRRFSHLIDPRTGRPASHRTVSVSVRHPDCARADGWATALNVLGSEEGVPLAERLGLAAQFVDEVSPADFRVTTTTNWESRDKEVGAL